KRRRKRRKNKTKDPLNKISKKRIDSNDDSFYRNNSGIFKRRSVIYRNNRKNRNTDSLSSTNSLNKPKRQNRFSNINYSLRNSVNSPSKFISFDSSENINNKNRSIVLSPQVTIDEIV
ncbi:unnamed protein product, partial [Brachionus calyciflorus]